MNLTINQTCNDLVIIISFMIFICIIFVIIFLIWRNIQKFQREIRSWGHRYRSEEFDSASIGDDGELIDLGQSSTYGRKKKKRGELPSVYGCFTQQLVIAILGLLTALISALATTNPVVSIATQSICQNVINVYPTPIAELSTFTPVPTIPTNTVTAIPSRITPTTNPSATPIVPTLGITAIPTITPIPTSTGTLTPQQRFFILPLDGAVFWPDGYNIGLRTAIGSVADQELLGIPFETGRQINTPGCPNSAHDTRYTIQTQIEHPLRVYFILQAGNGLTQYANDLIGRITLYFAEGGIVSEDLILGFNIRDWARDKNPQVAVISLSSNTAVEAWRGAASEPDSGWIGGMDMLTIDILPTIQTITLTAVELTDITTETIGSSQPCIHLQAVTVEVNS